MAKPCHFGALVWAFSNIFPYTVRVVSEILESNGSVIPQNDNNIPVVEAATKDKKKPTIKMNGKKNITTYQNKAIKLGKVTAKDDVDGNVTKKITVKVTKGKKNYSLIAKKVKANKSIKFTAEGKYIVTYTVKDSAGNKTTKKRYITVKPVKKVVPTTQVITTEQPVIIPTTEMPIITEQPMTEFIPVEISTTEYQFPDFPSTEYMTEYQLELSQLIELYIKI